MTVRDRVVLWVLATGLVAALLVWHSVGRWPALGVGLLALGIACVVYRIEAPRVDLEHPEGWEHRGTERSERIDQ